ncbi:MAG: type 1 glutamine amidotransferase [Pseudomonadota bacterium]
MLIGILQTGHAPDPVQEHHGDFEDMFARLLDGHGFTFKTWNVVDGDQPASVADADGWLVTGSKHGAYEDHAFIPPLEDFIRATFADGRPMVGVCFGHQIIAQAMGGTVKKYDGGWAVGHQDYQYNGRDLALNAWHQDQVVDLPKDAQVIGCNDFCANAALIYGDKIYTIQPHPELRNPIIQDYLKVRGSDPTYPRAIINRATDLADTPTADMEIAADIAAFFKGTFKPQVAS